MAEDPWVLGVRATRRTRDPQRLPQAGQTAPDLNPSKASAGVLPEVSGAYDIVGDP
jgi:hypothetical protein